MKFLMIAISLCLFIQVPKCQPGTKANSETVTLKLSTAIRGIVYITTADSLIAGQGKQIKVLDSITASKQATIEAQFRQIARLEGKAVADSLITVQYRQKEQDLTKMVKKARTGTTVTGIAGIVVTLLTIILLK